MPALEKVSANKAFGGQLTKYKFESESLGGLPTQINVFLPEAATGSTPAPALIYLAGLTCNEDTGPWKSGILRAAAAAGLAVVFPDTSPRGANVDGEDESWDFGTGAGFYLTATVEKFSKHYNMRSLVVDELPAVLKEAELPIDWSRVSLIGHSMGGHGALSLYLRQQTQQPSSSSSSPTFRAASAFSPICNPSECAWGKKAFGGYLASPSEWASYDSLALLPSADEHKKKAGGAGQLRIKVTYGTADQFYNDGQLRPEAFEKRARELGWSTNEVAVEREQGYDHSYYFISSFVDAHVDWHAKILKA